MTACGGGTIGYLFVAGTFYNQISGFKIDDYTGNLTPIEHGPFAVNANGPQLVLVKPGGRFVYVISSGTAPNPDLLNTTDATVTPNKPYGAPGDGGITIFAVGGDGVLTYQTSYQSLGFNPVWATFDGSGNYLYVTDRYSHYYCSPTAAASTTHPCLVANHNPANPINATNPTAAQLTDTNASITSFAVAGDTGRLTLVTNNAVLGLGTNLPLTVFEVPPSPVMSKIGSGSCLFTLGQSSIYPYVIGGNGQLTVATTGPFQVSGNPLTNLSSINTGGAYTYVTDAGANQIYTLSSGGTTCSFTQVSGSQQNNLSGTSTPVNSVTDSSGKFLYVLNQNSSGLPQGANPSQSTISAFTIQPGTGQLATLGDSTNNPYAVGSGPVCIVQDPTNQYLYISNNTDSTITGKLFDQRFGYLSNLSRGSVFATTMRPTCLAVSGNL